MQKLFQPQPTDDLSRIGSKNDGGYVCSLRSIEDSELLVSLGIGDNWEFESEFLKLKRGQCELILVDHSLGYKFWVWSSLRKIANSEFNVLNKAKGMFLFIKFGAFIRKSNVKFLPRKVGSVSQIGISLDEIMKENSSTLKYLKIDIEGSEYRILEEIIAELNFTTGLTIEFHDFDLHHEVVSSFVIKLAEKGFFPVWLNANNCAEISKNGLPEVVEFTFVHGRYINGKASQKDSQFWNPNNPKRPPLYLTFE